MKKLFAKKDTKSVDPIIATYHVAGLLVVRGERPADHDLTTLRRDVEQGQATGRLDRQDTVQYVTVWTLEQPRPYYNHIEQKLTQLRKNNFLNSMRRQQILMYVIRPSCEIKYISNKVISDGRPSLTVMHL